MSKYVLYIPPLTRSALHFGSSKHIQTNETSFEAVITNPVGCDI